jgi:hypothetical protein
MISYSSTRRVRKARRQLRSAGLLPPNRRASGKLHTGMINPCFLWTAENSRSGHDDTHSMLPNESDYLAANELVFAIV